VVLDYGESKSKSKGICGGLSTAAALPPSVEMTHFGVLGYGESKSNGKCGGLSAAAALPPSVEMTHFCGAGLRQKQKQKQRRMRGSLHCGGFAAFGRDDAFLWCWVTAKAKATANAGVSPLRRLCRLRSG
jgi:hypothetical protein